MGATLRDGVPVEGAIWSLARVVPGWIEAIGLATERGVVLVHPERGDLTVLDVACGNAHDAYRRVWDIARTLGSPTSTGR